MLSSIKTAKGKKTPPLKSWLSSVATFALKAMIGDKKNPFANPHVVKKVCRTLRKRSKQTPDKTHY